MTSNEGVDKVVENLSLRAHIIVEEGHSQMDILKSAFADFKAMGNVMGLMAIASTGKLTDAQIERAEKIAVKVISLLALREAAKAPKVSEDKDIVL
ncbi:hypothetical protein [Hafnia phage yong3]|nr:hypothetical protein [Hafnia phage yong3]